MATHSKENGFEKFGPSVLPGAARKRMGQLDLMPDRDLSRRAIRSSVPVVPGVYGWLDDRGQLVYVGKSKSLRSRLISYFAKSPTDEKMLRIRQRGRSLVWEPNCHELLALIREQELIDRWRPIYNSEGQPDKRRPAFLCISNDRAPKAFLSRNSSESAQEIYGPIIGTSELRETITSFNYVFQLRDCPDKTKMRFGNQLQLFESAYSPGCLRYELSSCPAPCTSACTVGNYQANVQAAIGFLNGSRSKVVIANLEEQMFQAAGRQAYEKAIVLRTQWKQMQWLNNRLHALRVARQQLHGIIRFRGFYNRSVWLILNEAGIEACLDDRDLSRRSNNEIQMKPPTHKLMPNSSLAVNWHVLLMRWFKKNKEQLKFIHSELRLDGSVGTAKYCA